MVDESKAKGETFRKTNVMEANVSVAEVEGY